MKAIQWSFAVTGQSEQAVSEDMPHSLLGNGRAAVASETLTAQPLDGSGDWDSLKLITSHRVFYL